MPLPGGEPAFGLVPSPLGPLEPPATEGVPGAEDSGAATAAAPSAAGPPPVRFGGFGGLGGFGGIGGIGLPFGPGPGEAGPPARGWNVRGSIGGQLTATDNIAASAGNRRADLITSINPSVLVSADTARVRGLLTYAPIAQIYASNDNQNRLDHYLNGRALAVLLPETVFLDLRGSAATQALSGGFAPEGASPVVDRRNRVQTTTFQVSPYAVHRFGTFATLQVGYAFQYVDQSAGGRGFGGSASGLPDQGFTAHQGYAVARTGEDFGRLALQTRLSGTTYSGSGVFDGARRNIALVEARYAITRDVAALVEGGWEEQRYAAVLRGTGDYKINEPIWAVGVRLTPGPTSVVTATYRRRDGFTSPFLDAAITLSGRSRILARYSEVLTTSALSAADLLSTTTVDALGNTVDSLTGAPVLPAFNNSFLAFQTGLLRLKRGLASFTQTWPRDTVTLSAIYEERRPVGGGAFSTTPTFSQRGLSGSIGWGHELTEDTQGFSFLQYGRTREGSGRGESGIFTFSLGLVHRINPRLTANLQYVLTNRDVLLSRGVDDFERRGAIQNVVIAGLRQFF